MVEQIPSLYLDFALWHSLIVIYCFWSFGAGFSGEEKGGGGTVSGELGYRPVLCV
jgi:hypothetical protein